MKNRSLDRSVDEANYAITALVSEIESLEAEVDELTKRLDDKEEERYAFWEELQELKNS